jgi:4-hydroxybenzoyl-CoA thioesterase/acyl-CoA thioester hydrolase
VAGPFTTRRRVEFRDTDAAGIVHFSAFFLWMESAEHELLRTVGIPVVEANAGGPGVDASWPRVSAGCDYVNAVRFGDEVDVAVSVEKLGTSSVTYGFAFTHGAVPVAKGRVVAVRCLMRSGRRPEAVPIPDDIAARLTPYRSGA